MAEILHIHAPLACVYSKADSSSEPSNTLLYGESAEVLENLGEFSKIRSAHDGYEGFVLSALLAVHQAKPHKISVPMTHVYDAPAFKTAPRHPLYFGSPVSTLDSRENGFALLANKGWVFERHMVEIDSALPDFVETAMMFLNAPYVWGGRSVAGVDCSGLVQIALMAAGIDCPRDTSAQIKALGQSIEFGDTIQYAQIQRGDLVFFERHVGIMVDDRHILNATSRYMKTIIEPLENLIEFYDGVLAVKRLP